MNSNLDNKVAIVTGAGSERGKGIALTLAQAGARVVVNDINPDRAERVAVAIRSEGYKALAVTADIANRFQCVTIIESTREQWGRIDILVNHTAVRPIAPILKMDEWAWQRCLDVNLKGAFFMSQLVGRVMADENQKRGGTIIHIGTEPADALPELGIAAYAASKGGLAAFVDRCAQELAPYGIRVLLVQPDSAVDKDRSVRKLDLSQTVLQLCYPETNGYSSKQ
jgi:NAD(P)-dependent dehydrogenase (short-subunit alcohol dehydrogenase family)